MKKNKGFTLIELLAVIVILGILLSISIVAVNNIRKKQNVENKLNVYSSVMTGAKNYIADNPSELDSLPKDIGVNLFWDDYVDFDKNEFPTIYYVPDASGDPTTNPRTVRVSQCSNSLKYKVEFHLKKDDGSTIKMDDCGCESQYSYLNDISSLKFCEAEPSNWIEADSTTDGKFTGWDVSGKYYVCTVNSTNDTDTETYMKANCSRPKKPNGEVDTSKDITD